MASTPPSDGDLKKALRDLNKSLEKLPEEFEYIIHPSKHLLLNYLRGIVYGLGAITAVAIVIPLIVWILQSIEWIPILGDFVEQIVNRVEQQ